MIVTCVCAECGEEFEHYKPGQIPERCEPCKRERQLEYMRNYMKGYNPNNRFMRRKYTRKTDHPRELKALETASLIEDIKREDVGEPSWDVDSIPSYSDIFKPHKIDSGSGIDSGCHTD